MPKIASSLIVGWWIVLAAHACAQADATPKGEAAEKTPPLVERGNELVQGLDRIRQRVADLEEDQRNASGEDLVVFQHQIAQAKLDYLASTSDLVDNLLGQERKGLDTSALRARVEADLERMGPAIARHIDDGQKELGRLRERREGVTGAALLTHEQRIQKETEWVDALYGAYFDQLEHLDRVGLPSSELRADLGARAVDRTDQLAGRIEISQDLLAELQIRLESDPNGKIWGDVIKNVTNQKIRRFDEAGLSPGVPRRDVRVEPSAR